MERSSGDGGCLAQAMEAKNRKAGIGSYGGCKTCLNFDPNDAATRVAAIKALAKVFVAADGQIHAGGDMNFRCAVHPLNWLTVHLQRG